MTKIRRAIRRGNTQVQTAVVLVAVGIAVIVGVRSVATNTNTRITTTNPGNPSTLSTYWKSQGS